MTIDQILESIYARTALTAIGAGAAGAVDARPVVLQPDHAMALRRIITDAADWVACRLRPCGACGATHNPADDTLTIDFGPDGPPLPAPMMDTLLREAVVNAALHITYAAAGIPSDHLMQADHTLALIRPARLTPTPY